MNDPREVQLILVECEAEFEDINFYFGGDDFALTVIHGNLFYFSAHPRTANSFHPSVASPRANLLGCF